MRPIRLVVVALLALGAAGCFPLHPQPTSELVADATSLVVLADPDENVQFRLDNVGEGNSGVVEATVTAGFRVEHFCMQQDNGWLNPGDGCSIHVSVDPTVAPEATGTLEITAATATNTIVVQLERDPAAAGPIFVLLGGPFVGANGVTTAVVRNYGATDATFFSAVASPGWSADGTDCIGDTLRPYVDSCLVGFDHVDSPNNAGSLTVTPVTGTAAVANIYQ